MEIEILTRVIEKAGGPTALARALDIKSPSIHGWTRVPAERVLRVSEITGIPPHEIRPDVFAPPPNQVLSQDDAA
jgi:DNA-binding transcriptional regulator YdaS (Cro superfamily)